MPITKANKPFFSTVGTGKLGSDSAIKLLSRNKTVNENPGEDWGGSNDTFQNPSWDQLGKDEQERRLERGKKINEANDPAGGHYFYDGAYHKLSREQAAQEKANQPDPEKELKLYQQHADVIKKMNQRKTKEPGWQPSEQEIRRYEDAWRFHKSLPEEKRNAYKRGTYIPQTSLNDTGVDSVMQKILNNTMEA